MSAKDKFKKLGFEQTNDKGFGKDVISISYRKQIGRKGKKPLYLNICFDKYHNEKTEISFYRYTHYKEKYVEYGIPTIDSDILDAIMSQLIEIEEKTLNS